MDESGARRTGPTRRQVIAAGASALAALVNAGVGLLIAWVLSRYAFPGRRLMDALIDLPFALPTAVAVGLVNSEELHGLLEKVGREMMSFCDNYEQERVLVN